ncbi:tyrosine-type recombinase/integrase [Salinarchaeum laminariae]|uniref:tyrosine-type recombinase/integrase n=1 Tax=Salinarchaeum laminariae TaxID=869888 RepID=UPI0020BD5417|nr:tyrosine-type recombinase/integrase [Salinarchaeum laminariae]
MTAPEHPPEITAALTDAVDNHDTVQRHYSEFYEWMLTAGADPNRREPLRAPTAENYVQRLDRIHRQILNYIHPEDDSYIRDDHADVYLYLVDSGNITKQNGDEYGESSKRKLADTLQKYFLWRYNKGDLDYQWKPEIAFSDEKQTTTYKFNYVELGRLLETAETYSSMPSYHSASEEERGRISALVAQRLGIKKDAVTQNDWLHADDSAKTHALVAVSYDAGLAPIEIENAEPSWYDSSRQTLRIPTEHACKQRGKEIVALSDRSAEALSRWLRERRLLEKYDDTSKLWLNRDGNTYDSANLCYLIKQLCEEAGIEADSRKIRWYSLRKSMGRNLTQEGDLSEANDQLRHELLESTKEYDETPVAKLRNRINESHDKAARAAADPTYDPYADENDAATGETSPDDAITRNDNGTIHVDAMIQDNTDAKVDVTQQLLDDD